MGRFLAVLASLTLAAGLVSGGGPDGGPKLSLPRALLPFGATPPSLILHVSSTSGCYSWSSSREDVVTVVAVDGEDGCSVSARITAHPYISQRQTAIVFAENVHSQQILRCDVIIDRIASLEIVTTSRELFVEEAPEAFEVRAYDDQGNEFTSLDGIEFTWTIVSTLKNSDVIRIITFSESSYETSDILKQMEERGARGHTVLLEGVSTGTAKVIVKLPYPEYSSLKPTEVTLRVVANLLIMPPDTSVQLLDVINFKIIKVSEGRLIELKQPSSQYWLEIEDSSIANLNKKTGKAVAKTLGQTRVFLRDAGEGAESDAAHLPEAFLRVVTPHTLQLEFRPLPTSRLWSVQLGSPFTLIVHILDSQGRRMYVGTETRVGLKVDESMVDVQWRSINGTVLNGVALQSGVVPIEASLISVANVPVEGNIQVEGELHIYDKIEIIPPKAIIPFNSILRQKSEIQLEAIGGDGTYVWRSEGSTTVNPSGLVTGIKLGNATVFASMTSNSHIFGTANILVIEPLNMEIVWYEEEGPVGSNLEIHVALFSTIPLDSENNVPVTSCSPLSFKIISVEGIKFEMQYSNDFVDHKKSSGVGCTILHVQCSEAGSGLVKVQWGNLEAGLSLRCFAPLKRVFPPPSKDYLLLTVGSSHNIIFEGGPITWYEESDKQIEIKNSQPDIARISSFHLPYDSQYHVFTVTCLEVGKTQGYLKMFGSSSSLSNVNSKSTEAIVEIHCSNPHSIKLALKHNRSALCPTTSLQQMAVLNGGEPVEIEVTVFDTNGKVFNNATSLRFRWSANPPTILPELPSERLLTRNDMKYQVPIVNYHYQVVRIFGDELLNKNSPKEILLEVLGFRPTVLKLAEVHKTPNLSNLIKSSLSFKLITPVHVSNKKITVYNQPGNAIKIPLMNGSGSFQLGVSSTIHAQASLDSSGRSITIQPYSDGEFSIAVNDLCVSYSALNIQITVVSIANIITNIPELIEKGRNVLCTVHFYDRMGSILSNNIEGAPSLISQVTKGHINAIREKDNGADSDGILYTVTGLEIGDASIEFTAGTIRGVANTYVFPPLMLDPQHSVILPGGNIKIGVIGGPPPPATIQFNRNSGSSEIVEVSKSGIVKGLGLGMAKIEAHAEGFQGADYIYASAAVQVVGLEGISIHAPTSTLLIEKTMPMWAIGIPDSLTPLQLGSLKPSLRFRWSISGEGAVSITDILSNTGVEFDDSDRVAIRLTAIQAGSVTVHLNVTTSPNSQIGRISGHSWYTYFNLVVVEPLELKNPSLKSTYLILSPHTEISLQTNYPLEKLTYKLMEDSEVSSKAEPLAKITSDGKLVTFGRLGFGVISIYTIDSQTSIKQHISFAIEVCIPHYSMLELDPKYKWESLNGLGALPSGLSLPLVLLKYDILGRKFSDSTKNVRYVTNRPDIILSGANTSHLQEVLLATAGQAVIKIWDTTSEKQQYVDYISIEILPAIYPQKIVATVGDLWCMRSAIQQGSWIENLSEIVWSTSSGLMQARASRVAATAVIYQPPAGLPYVTQATVVTRPVDMIYFLDSESKYIVTDEKPSIVYLVLANREEQNKNKNLLFSENNCIEENIEFFPFTCEIKQPEDLYNPHVNVIPVFNKHQGTYGCQITWSPDASLVSQNISYDLNLIVRSGIYVTEPISIRCIRAVKIQNENVILSPPPAYLAPLDVTATPEVLKEITVIEVLLTSESEILSIDAPIRTSDTSLRFIIRGGKNIDTAQKSHVKLISPMTQQIIQIPVSINGNSAGFLSTCVSGGSSFLSQLFEHYQFVILMLITAVSIFAATVYVFGNFGNPFRKHEYDSYAGNIPAHDMSSDIRNMSYSSRSPFSRSPSSFSQPDLSSSIHSTSPQPPLDTSGSAVYGDPSYLATFERRRNRRFL